MGTIFLLNYFEDPYFFIGLKLYDVQVYNLYVVYAFNINAKSFIKIGSENTAFNFTQMKKKIDNTNQEVIILTAFLPLSYTSMTIDTFWNRNSTDQMPYGNFAYSPNQYVTQGISSKDNDYIITGYKNGQVRVVSSSADISSFNIIYQTTTLNKISSVQYSFYLKQYFIVTNQINCYSIHSRILLEVITFASQLGLPTQETIKNVLISDRLSVLIAYVSTEIIVRNFSKSVNNKFSLILSDSNSKLKAINGFFLDEYTQELIIYGDQVIISNLKLDNQTVISPTNLSNDYKNCVLTDDLFICRSNSTNVQFYNRKNQYKLQSSIALVAALTNCKIAVDKVYQQVFLYNMYLEIYTFQGIFIGSTSAITFPILSFNFYDAHIAIMTTPAMYIFKRGTITYATAFTASGGSFIGSIYISSQKLIAYYSDAIKYGQIQLFSLDTYQPAGFIINAYDQNKIGRVLKIIYDTESTMLNYLDLYGNNQNIIFNNQKTTDNVFSIEEIQSGKDSPPVDYFIDFITNTVYIHNGLKVWTINYNLLTKQHQRLMDRPNNHYFLVQNNDSSSSYLLISDYNNNIFKYSNYQVQFCMNFQNEIIDTIQLTKNDAFRYVLIFKSTIIIFESVSENCYEPSSYKRFDGVQFKKTLFSKESIAIINTLENTIIEYDHFNYKTVFTYQLDLYDDITAKVEIGSSSGSIWSFCFGLSSGRVGCYDIINKSIKFSSKIIDISNNLITLLQVYSNQSNNFVCVDKQGNIIMMDFITLQPIADQVIDQQIYNVPMFQNLTNPKRGIQFIKFDQTFNRIYVNFKKEKRLGIWDLNTLSFLQYLSFPDSQYKNLIQSDSVLILASAFQINAYSISDLSFIGYIRKYNRRDFITEIRVLDNTKLIVVFSIRIEVILIKAKQKQLTSIDTYTLDDSKILNAYILQPQYILVYVGVSKDRIFEKRISLNLYDNDQYNKSPNSMLNCVSTIKYLDYVTAQKSFEQIYNANYLTQNFYISVNLFNNLNDIDFLNKQQVKVTLKPYSDTQKSLVLKSDSLTKAQFDLKIEGFDFSLQNEMQVIQTSAATTKVILQNIVIENQDINKGPIFLFNGKTIVVIKQLTIRNINIISTSDEGEADEGSTNPFFSFINCTSVVIQNVFIENLNLNSKTVPLIYSSATAKLIIEDFNISKSQFYKLVDLYQSNSVTISRMQINDCQIPKIYQNVQHFSLNLIGVGLISISNLDFTHNRDICIVYTNKSYTISHGIVTLQDDQVSQLGGLIYNNTFSNVEDSFKSKQFNLISFYSTYVKINEITFLSNEGNIYFENGYDVSILNSKFKDNINVSGGAIFAQNIIASLSISNSTFLKNTASANGGALFLYEVKQFNIDENSFIFNNNAAIGGGIRIISADYTLWKSYLIDSNFKDNKAEIFGDNIGSFPQNIQVLRKLEQDSNNLADQYTKIFSDNILQESSSPTIILDNIQSGGILPIGVQLFDQDNRVITVNITKYKNNTYHTSIIEELNTYYLEVTNDQYISQESSKIVEMKGESMIGIKQYDQDMNTFRFQSLTLTSQPMQIIDLLKLKVAMNVISFSSSIQIKIRFRECKQGEILVYSDYQLESNSQTYNSHKLVSCSKCLEGTYSLIQSDQATQQSQINSLVSQVCKKCPSSAEYCEQNTIQLYKGYWRENNSTDEILECNTIKDEICNEELKESKNGCIEGYLGPLCEKCDTLAQVWSDRYASSIAQYSCIRCSRDVFQKIFLVFSLLIMFTYLLFSVFFFMGRYVYESKCYYLRQMKILPFSKSCILDESSYYIKCLINYLQLSSLLFKLNANIFPQLIGYLPAAIGQPASNAVLSTTCVYSKDMLIEYGEERLLIFTQALLPIIYFVSFFIILFFMQRYKIYEVGKFHKYTMLNVIFLFFQPDCLSYFTKALSCRTIGSKQYQAINILLSCSEKSYLIFSYYFVLPNLIFWILTPSIIFLRLYKDKGKQNEKLKYCTTRFKYGYFYLEFKSQFFYWEFVRIYLKTLIILITTLLTDFGKNLYVLCIIMIFFYIFLVIRFKPFDSKFLNRLELIAYLIIIPNIFLSELYKNYTFVGLQVAIFVLHYGFLVYIFWIIVKVKISSNYIQSVSLVKYIINSFCCKIFFMYCKLKKYDNPNTLARWRRVYKSLTLIRLQQTNHQINKLNDIIRNKTLYSPIGDLKGITFPQNELNLLNQVENSYQNNTTLQGLEVKKVESLENNIILNLSRNREMITKQKTLNQSQGQLNNISLFAKQNNKDYCLELNLEEKHQSCRINQNILSKDTFSPSNCQLVNSESLSKSTQSHFNFEIEMNEKTGLNNKVFETLKMKQPTQIKDKFFSKV